jgi:hypothetical protein
MNSKRALAILLAALMLALVAAAPALADQQGNQPQQNGQMGQVTKIDGNTITIALASMDMPGGGNGQASPDANGQASQGNPPSDANGQVPQGNAPSDNNGQAPQGNPPSDNNGQAPQGNPPTDNNGQAPQGNVQTPSLTLTGETLSFTVNDSTQITLRGGRDQQDTAGSLSNIQVDSVVTVVVTDGVATSISVRQAMAAPDANASPNATEAPASN